MTLKQYLIGTCLGCKKCLYCGSELSIRKRMCLCDKTIKPGKVNRTDKVNVVYSRIPTPHLPLKRLKYLQKRIIHFNYSLDLDTTFKFTFCPACNSAFQRIKNNNNVNNSNENNLDNSNDNDHNTSNDNSIDLTEPDELEIDEKSEAEQVISFNLIIKPSTGPALPSKWLEIEVSSIDDILADVHHHIGKLTGDKDIMNSDYLVSFKPEKSTGVGAQLVDIQDYKKFLSDYKKLLDKKKHMVILVSLKKEKKQKRKVKIIYLLHKINFI